MTVSTDLPYIIVIGDPVSGFEFYGPYANADEAATVAMTDGNLPDHNWWIAPLHPATEPEQST